MASPFLMNTRPISQSGRSRHRPSTKSGTPSATAPRHTGPTRQTCRVCFSASIAPPPRHRSSRPCPGGVALQVGTRHHEHGDARQGQVSGDARTVGTGRFDPDPTDRALRARGSAVHRPSVKREGLFAEKLAFVQSRFDPRHRVAPLHGTRSSPPTSPVHRPARPAAPRRAAAARSRMSRRAGLFTKAVTDGETCLPRESQETPVLLANPPPEQVPPGQKTADSTQNGSPYQRMTQSDFPARIPSRHLLSPAAVVPAAGSTPRPKVAPRRGSAGDPQARLVALPVAATHAEP